MHNPILKQAVIKFDNDFVITPFLDKSWDLNGNGLLDVFVKTTPEGCTSEDTYLFALIADALGIARAEDLFNESMTIILSSGQMREHCYLTQDMAAGTSSIFVHDLDPLDKNLKNGARIEIGNWLTERSPTVEYFYIKDMDGIDYVNKKVNFKDPSTKIHKKGESFYYTGTLGYTYTNVSVVSCGNVTVDAVNVHELLHQERFGGLDHVANGLDASHEYKSNLMYWALNPASVNLLCGRGLISEEDNIRQKQWLNVNNSH
jgi:hypothetical protein